MKFLTTLHFEIEFSLAQYTKLIENNVFNEDLQFLVDLGRGGTHRFSGSLKMKKKLRSSIVYNAIIDVKLIAIITLFTILVTSVLFVIILGYNYLILSFILSTLSYIMLRFKVKNDVKTRLFELSSSITKTK